MTAVDAGTYDQFFDAFENSIPPRVNLVPIYWPLVHPSLPFTDNSNLSVPLESFSVLWSKQVFL